MGPERGRAHQRRGVVETGRHRRDKLGSRLGRVADRDQHVSDKAVAADALDRGAGEQGAECRVVEPGQLGETRRGQFRAGQEIRFFRGAGEFVPRDRPRGNRRSHRCGCRSAGAARAGSGPYARSSDTRRSAVHRAGREPGTRPSGRRRDSAGRRRNGRLPAGRAAMPGSDRSRRETARSRNRATRGSCACPASRCPACCASGFSMTGAVSTNTFNSPGQRATIQRANALSRFLTVS